MLLLPYLTVATLNALLGRKLKKNMYYNVSVKKFPDGTKQYTFYNKSVRYGDNKLKIKHSEYYKDKLDRLQFVDVNNNENNQLDINFKEEKEEKLEKIPNDRTLLVSHKRSVNKIYDIARSNDWDYFFTLTLNPMVVDRYNYEDCINLIKKFTKYLGKHNCVWLIVPEQHDDGAWHFHGLLKTDDESIFVRSHVRYKDDWVYNFKNYEFGFTSATKIVDLKRVSTYITKYMTKCFNIPVGKKRYWASRSCAKPVTLKLDYDLETLSFKKDMISNLSNYDKHIEYGYYPLDMYEF